MLGLSTMLALNYRELPTLLRPPHMQRYVARAYLSTAPHARVCAALLSTQNEAIPC